MSLETLTPAPDAVPAVGGEAIESLAGLDARDRILVWCDDGCKDCQALLPGFAAALDAAGIPDERVVQYAVERLPAGRKRGPQVEAYGIERIPTVVVERDGVDIARFVEGTGDGDDTIADTLARQLAAADATR